VPLVRRLWRNAHAADRAAKRVGKIAGGESASRSTAAGDFAHPTRLDRGGTARQV